MKVRIYKPSKTAMQSGRAKTENWVLEYETTSARTPESLMGWVASEDTLNQVRINFPSQKEAISFAKNKGWDYTVSAPQEKIVIPRNYGDNFKYEPRGSADK